MGRRYPSLLPVRRPALPTRHAALPDFDDNGGVRVSLRGPLPEQASADDAPNHYEQACNALDGQRAGAAIASDRFDLNRLMNYLSFYDTRVSQRFRDWQATSQIKFVAALQADSPTDSFVIHCHESLVSKRSSERLLPKRL